MPRAVLFLCALVFLPVRIISADDPPPPAAPPAAAAPPDQAALEKEFAEALSGSDLVGTFTMGESKELHEERYTIAKVSKLKDDLWLFQAKIKYGDRNVTVPLPLAVKWAGDTPVITLTDLEIPGLGKYTARVVIYRGQYAGTWSGGDHGGHLFGRIEKAKSDQKKEPPANP
jgi:hypothetical protein